MYVCMFVCTYVHMYVCTYVFTYVRTYVRHIIVLSILDELKMLIGNESTVKGMVRYV